MTRTTLLLAALVLGCGNNASESSSGGTTEGSEGTEGTGSTEGTGAEGTEGGTEAATGELVVGTDACTTDADCVPAGCCHPASCVAAANAPSCGDVMCTMECRIGTLDCGGSCLCHEGHCAARLMGAPAAVTDLPPG